jgi:AcrR family transcriptional regulator
MPEAGSAAPDRGGKASGAYHHGDLRQALLAAARAEVAREGPEQVSLSGLARSLGVSQPAPYRHFADRETLLAAVAGEGFDLYETRIREALAGASRFVAPSRIARAHIVFGLAERGLYRLMFAPPAPWRGETAARGEAAFERLLQAVRDIGYGQGARRRAVRIWAAAHGLVMIADQGPFARDLAADALSALIEDVVG